MADGFEELLRHINAGRITYQPCGCLTNDADAHRGDCPEWRTVKDINNRPLHWVRREERA